MDTLATLPDRIRRLSEAHAAQRIDRAALLEGATRLVATGLGGARAGVWQFVELPGGERVLRSLAMYDAGCDAMVAVPDSRDIGAYFLTLSQTGYIHACDVDSHFATTGPLARRLTARRIRSLLAASLAVNGKVCGAVTCAVRDRQVEWSTWQINGLRRVASGLAVALFADEVSLAIGSATARA